MIRIEILDLKYEVMKRVGDDDQEKERADAAEDSRYDPGFPSLIYADTQRDEERHERERQDRKIEQVPEVLVGPGEHPEIVPLTDPENKEENDRGSAYKEEIPDAPVDDSFPNGQIPDERKTHICKGNDVICVPGNKGINNVIYEDRDKDRYIKQYSFSLSNTYHKNLARISRLDFTTRTVIMEDFIINT